MIKRRNIGEDLRYTEYDGETLYVYMDMPSFSLKSFCTVADDGTHVVYVNARTCSSIDDVREHEQEHFDEDDLNSDRTADEIERDRHHR